MAQSLEPVQAHSRDSITFVNEWMKRASAVSGCVEQTGLFIKCSCMICFYLMELVNGSTCVNMMWF